MAQRGAPKKPKITRKMAEDAFQRCTVGGESVASVAREYGVHHHALQSAISKFSEQPIKVRQVAKKLAEANQELMGLQPVARSAAMELADNLKMASLNLSSAALSSSATAKRLAKQAEQLSEKVNNETDEGVAALRDVVVLTKAANEAASLPLDMLKNSKPDLSDKPRHAPSAEQKTLDDATKAYRLLLGG